MWKKQSFFFLSFILCVYAVCLVCWYATCDGSYDNSRVCLFGFCDIRVLWIELYTCMHFMFLSLFHYWLASLDTDTRVHMLMAVRIRMCRTVLRATVSVCEQILYNINRRTRESGIERNRCCLFWLTEWVVSATAQNARIWCTVRRTFNQVKRDAENFFLKQKLKKCCQHRLRIKLTCIIQMPLTLSNGSWWLRCGIPKIR